MLFSICRHQLCKLSHFKRRDRSVIFNCEGQNVRKIQEIALYHFLRIYLYNGAEKYGGEINIG